MEKRTMNAVPGYIRLGDIESALARVHDIDEAGSPALKSAIANLRGIGLCVTRSATGRPTPYTYNDAFMFAAAMELMQSGFPPSGAVETLAAIAGPLEHEVARLGAKRAGATDRFLVIYPNVVSNRLRHERKQMGAIDFAIVDADDMAKLYMRRDGRRRTAQRILAINLTKLNHDLASALQAAVEAARVVEFPAAVTA
jgi:hypothetical protein